MIERSRASPAELLAKGGKVRFYWSWGQVFTFDLIAVGEPPQSCSQYTGAMLGRFSIINRGLGRAILEGVWRVK